MLRRRGVFGAWDCATHLPAADYSPKEYLLPMWAYTAVGFREGRYWAAGFRIEYNPKWDPRHYDDRKLVTAIRSYRKKHGRVMAGVELNDVRELLGHKKMEMTLRYAHLSPRHKGKVVNILDRIFDMSQNPPQVGKVVQLRP